MDSEYEQFVHSLDLTGIYLVDCSAKRTGGASLTEPLETSLSLESAQRVAEDAFDYRFDFSCVVSQDGDEVARVSATYVASYATELTGGVSDALVQRFAQDVAIMAVYPYMREFAQSMAARLDLPNFTLGLVKRGELVIEGPSMSAAEESST